MKLIGLAASAAILAPVSAAAKPTVSEAVATFRAACLGGSIQLDPNRASKVSFSNIPQPARVAMTHAIFAPQAYLKENPLDPHPATSADVPNSIYRLEKKPDYFLIPATPEPIPTAKYADSCTVLWRGDYFIEAREAFTPKSLPQHGKGVDLFKYASIDDGAYKITIASLQDWTVLRSELSPQEVPADVPAASGAEKK